MSELTLFTTLVILACLCLIDHKISSRSLWLDTSSNLATWGLNLAVAAVAISWMTPLYYWAYENKPDLWQQDSVLFWPLAILIYDFLYYWFHRLSHKVSLLWAVHSVHHQCRVMTPSLGVRSSALDFAVAWMILLPMIFMGFSSQHLMFALTAHGIYQIFLHNNWPIKLGRLESILNSHNHHAVHHAINPEYVDKNFGSIFIVWDKLFGTFVSRQQPVEIGILGDNHFANPLMSNLAPYLQVIHPRLVKAATHITYDSNWIVFIYLIICLSSLLNIMLNTIPPLTWLACVLGILMALGVVRYLTSRSS